MEVVNETPLRNWLCTTSLRHDHAGQQIVVRCVLVEDAQWFARRRFASAKVIACVPAGPEFAPAVELRRANGHLEVREVGGPGPWEAVS